MAGPGLRVGGEDTLLVDLTDVRRIHYRGPEQQRIMGRQCVTAEVGGLGSGGSDGQCDSRGRRPGEWGE